MTHVPVLLKEVLGYLNPQPGENFIDATFGGGGHAVEILKKIAPDGKLLGIDLDLTQRFSPETGSENLIASEPLVPRSSLSEVGLSRSGIETAPFTGRLFLENGNFKEIESISKRYFPEGVAGVLFDFGFSSYHIDKSGRGFSYLKDEPLDMRFYRSETSIDEITAVKIINDWSERELERIFKEYGEEREAGEIARAVVEARRRKRIGTTGELVEVLDRTHKTYGANKIKTLARIFQALRIAVNNELENIKQGLTGAWQILKPGGRIAAISFHSLEDRIVKSFFNEKKQAGGAVILTKKPVMPTVEEVRENPRARSAKLRVVRKI